MRARRARPVTATRPGGAGAPRSARRSRATKETEVEVALDLDGAGEVHVSTGIGFFDHMVAQLGRHGGWDLELRAAGDLHVDTHHCVEDVGITLGETFAAALGDKRGVRRFASIALPLDEALVEVAVDLSGRAYLLYEVDPCPGGETVLLGEPGFDPQLAEEFWRALVGAAGLTLHLRSRSGRNTHHILEASFKGVARALRDAARIEGGGIPSTKGTL